MKVAQYFLIFFIFHKSFSFATIDWGEELSKFKATDKNNDQLWNKYKNEFRKNYTDDKDNTDDKKHKDKFLKHVKEIIKHNKKYKEKTVTYKQGINQFTDMLPNELKKIHNISMPKNSHLKTIPETNISFLLNENLPENFNWIQEGFNSEVYDQGFCNSCYAFSAIGSIEGNYFKIYKKNVKISEQELIDCGKSYDMYGCNGGSITEVFRYSENIGISSLKNYPYVGRKRKCHKSTKGTRVKVEDFYKISYGDEYGVQYAIVNYGPVSAGVDIRNPSFDKYTSGIYSEPLCSSNLDDMTHTLLVVGYGTSGGEDYWILKNQWGYSWGDGGYMKMLRNGKNHCGIASAAICVASVR